MKEEIHVRLRLMEESRLTHGGLVTLFDFVEHLAMDDILAIEVSLRQLPFEVKRCASHVAFPFFRSSNLCLVLAFF